MLFCDLPTSGSSGGGRAMSTPVTPLDQEVSLEYYLGVITEVSIAAAMAIVVQDNAHQRAGRWR
jgi:hypothetical protein